MPLSFYIISSDLFIYLFAVHWKETYSVCFPISNLSWMPAEMLRTGILPFRIIHPIHELSSCPTRETFWSKPFLWPKTLDLRPTEYTAQVRQGLSCLTLYFWMDLILHFDTFITFLINLIITFIINASTGFFIIIIIIFCLSKDFRIWHTLNFHHSWLIRGQHLLPSAGDLLGAVSLVSALNNRLLSKVFLIQFALLLHQVLVVIST